jgi:FkbM family methyltransferase
LRDKLTSDPGFAALGLVEEFSKLPLSFIDIGARNGVHELIDPIARLSAVLGFEPDPEECRRLLADPAITSPWASFDLEPIALSNQIGDVPLHLAAVATNHSLLPAHDPFIRRYAMPRFEGRGATSIAATTLDDVLFSRRAGDPHLGEFLKIDTQGSEWEILDGARRCLSERCVAVYAECWFGQVYSNVRPFSDVEQLLRDHGFAFYGFTTWHTRARAYPRYMDKRIEVGRERPIYADAVFLKDPLAAGFRPVTLSDRQSRVLFTCAVLLGYFDFALELGDAIWASRLDARQAAHGLVHRAAALDPAATAQEVAELAERVRAAPDRANLEAGRFADRRRMFWDYDDWPKQ